MEIRIVKAPMIGTPELCESGLPFSPNIAFPFGGECHLLRAFAINACVVKIASLYIEHLPSFLGDAQLRLSPAGRQFFGFLAILTNTPDLSVRNEEDGAVGCNGQIRGGGLGSYFANADGRDFINHFITHS